MARQTDKTLSALTVAGLTASAALALTRVFTADSWLVTIMAAVAIATACVWWADRRGASSAGLAIALSALGAFGAAVVISPSTLWYGLPTAETLSDVAAGLSDGAETLRTASVPVAVADSALLMAFTATWASAAVGAWLALRLDATVGAVVPSLALYTVVSALGKGPWLWTAIVYATAVGVFLLTQQQRLLGRRRSLFRGGRRSTTGAVVGGLAATALAVCLGAVIAPHLPGAAAEGWLDYRDFGGSGGPSRLRIVSPLVDIRSSLVQQEPIEMFRVRSDAPAYWRLIALEDFDGRVWGLSDDSVPASAGLGARARSVTTVDVTQEYELAALGGHLLPAAFEPVSISGTDARVLPDTSTIIRDDVTAGLDYRLISQVPSPTPAQLQALPAADPGANGPLTELPDDFPDSVRAIAQDVTVGSPSAYDALIALQNWFRSNFEYSLSTGPGHSSADIEEFVLETRAGYCEQFAGSYAAMARSLGYPARVAVGFQPGTPEGGSFVVTGLDAHAWPEVYLDGIGWTSFEPTPSRFEPSANDHTGTQAEALAVTGDPGATTSPQGTPIPPSPGTDTTPTTAASDADPRVREPDSASAAATRSDANGWRDELRAAVLDHPWRSVALALVAASACLAVAAASIAVAKAARTRRRRREPDPRRSMELAWAEATDRLLEAGIRIDPAITPTEFALRRAPAQGAGAAGAPLMDLARLVTAARYSPDAPAPDQVERGWRASDGISEGLNAGATASQRFHRRIDWRVLRRPERSRQERSAESGTRS